MHPVFEALPVKDRLWLAQRSRLRRLKPGDCLVGKNEAADHAWVTVDGMLYAQVDSPAGKAVTVEIFRTGDLFGCLCFMADGRHFYDVFALTRAEVLAVPTQAVFRFADDRPGFCGRLMKNVALRVRRLVELRAITGERSERKVCELLSWLSQGMGSRIPMTQAMVGALAGLSSETISRLMGPLKKKGWITVRRREILIHHAGRLKAAR